METAYRKLPYRRSELSHGYGRRVHILARPALLTPLARACHPLTAQPDFSRVVASLYRSLAEIVADAELPRVFVRSRTRMKAFYEGQIIDPSTRIVCVDILRAGIVPAQACFEQFCRFVDPRNVRQDHLMMNRRTDARGRVVGVDFTGSKIGGRVDGAIVVIPDPMAATGGSMAAAVAHYRELGRPKKIVALHLIASAEALRRVPKGVTLYAIRADRGLSPRGVFARRLGADRRERGLDARSYIVPGGGGFGELLSGADR